MTAMHATRERWCEAEAHRVAGEIALQSPQRDVAKAQAYFEHALTIARAQQAKAWELRAAMSLARLLSDQGKRQTARDLLAPVYDWFTEGFDTSRPSQGQGTARRASLTGHPATQSGLCTSGPNTRRSDFRHLAPGTERNRFRFDSSYFLEVDSNFPFMVVFPCAFGQARLIGNRWYGVPRWSASFSGLLRRSWQAAACRRPEIARPETSDDRRHFVFDVTCWMRAQYGAA